MDSDEIEHGTLLILINSYTYIRGKTFIVYFITLEATLRSYFCFNFVKKNGKAVQHQTIGGAGRKRGYSSYSPTTSALDGNE